MIVQNLKKSKYVDPVLRVTFGITRKKVGAFFMQICKSRKVLCFISRSVEIGRYEQTSMAYYYTFDLSYYRTAR